MDKFDLEVIAKEMEMMQSVQDAFSRILYTEQLKRAKTPQCLECHQGNGELVRVRWNTTMGPQMLILHNGSSKCWNQFWNGQGKNLQESQTLNMTPVCI